MDLDSVSIRALKDIMIRMGISPHDCFERRDLKKKLIDNVPELRMAMERKASLTSQSSTASFTSMGSSSSFSGGGSFMNCKSDFLLEIHRGEGTCMDRWLSCAYEFHYYLRYE